MADCFTNMWEKFSDKKAAKKRADYVLKYIKRHNSKAKEVLELGVGIGQVIQHFPKKYEISGLDIKKDYIHICKKKFPKYKFYVLSMHNFKINKKFDVIFSVYDSINFLKNIKQWELTFNQVNKHLKENGLFIFDMYTEKSLEYFKDNSEYTKNFKLGYVHSKGIVKGNQLIWYFNIFEKKLNNSYKIHKNKFIEYIHPTKKIKNELGRYFKILEENELESGRRLLFVCRKK